MCWVLIASSACYEWRSTVTYRGGDGEWTQREHGRCDEIGRGRDAARVAREGVAVVACGDERQSLRVGITVAVITTVVVLLGLMVVATIGASAN